MKPIGIYGYGGLGREVACMIKAINKIKPCWEIIGFFDDSIEKVTQIDSLGQYLGGIEQVNSWPTEMAVVICIGNPKTLQHIRSRINNTKLTFPNSIADDFTIEDKATFSIGEGNIIKSGCRVTTNIKIGNFNIFNGGVTLGHDVEIEDYNVIMPGVRISGEVSVGYRNLLGSMSFIKQGLKVGNDIVLSPLSPLLTNPTDGKTYIGNPAKVFKF